jgi:hypothetical protein
MSLKMAKRSLGELGHMQRLVLQQWANHMGVTERHMVNLLNSLDNMKDDSPWNNLDKVASVVQDCDEC